MKALYPHIVYETNDFLIVDKPTGWITNSSSTSYGQPVLQDWLKVNFDYPISKSKEFRSGIVHRLDKLTSGILIVAKTQEVFVEFQRQFKSREVAKTYTLLVHDLFENKVGNIDAPVGRLPWRKDRFGVLPGGRNAYTRYEVVKEFTKVHDKFSLVKAYPKTGRTHQLRIHFKYIRHPIVSDVFYAGRKTSRHDLKWCPRLFLHASAIEIFDPTNQKRVKYDSNLPDDLQAVLDTLDE